MFNVYVRLLAALLTVHIIEVMDFPYKDDFNNLVNFESLKLTYPVLSDKFLTTLDKANKLLLIA